MDADRSADKELLIVQLYYSENPLVRVTLNVFHDHKLTATESGRHYFDFSGCWKSPLFCNGI